MAIVYRHIRLDKNQPFYIGIGKDISRAYVSSGRNNLWKNIVSKTEFEVEVLFDDVDLGFAKNKEKELIALYGRKNNNTGILANMTDGGDGTRNWIPTENTKKNMSIAKKKNPTRYWAGKHFSKSHKEKLSKACAKTRNNRVWLYNEQDGIFYHGIKEASKAYNINYGTLKNKLSKWGNKNDTSIKRI